ncbi:MAG TPA: FAD-dependent oxidoreductase [Gemmatimonadaceae bacterium]|jgi:glycine/D-amino acid oxidase-like deaminating enzyme|nr:FAD-dependent oxidoreductase [Gemmatimonadaceae bacterium]
MTLDRTRPVGRREVLKQACIAAGGAVLASSCGRGVPAIRGVPEPRAFARVRVAADRVIRSITGLRPFRPSGFVVRADRADDRTIVHNYGHGGGGITLSWGSSSLAVDLATAVESRRVAVIGCGVMGLTTARLLQDRGFEATIYAKQLPPDTTSNVAGAQWSPYTVFDDESATPAFRQQLERVARLSNRYFQSLVGDTYGVRWIENYVLRDNPPAQQQASSIRDLFFAPEVLPRHRHPFAAPYVSRFTTMLIEPPVFLPAIMHDFLLRGGKIHVREFREPRDLFQLEERVIVNCVGLGARDLFGDSELTPIKGQLAILLPQPEVDYILLKGDYYMFPRRDGIVLGGTHDRGEWRLDADPAVTDRILTNHRAIFEQMH